MDSELKMVILFFFFLETNKNVLTPALINALHVYWTNL